MNTLTTQQRAALALFRSLDTLDRLLTAEEIATLQHLTREVVEHDDLQRLRQFAVDSADINPNLLRDIESGTVRPCPALMSGVEEFYAGRTGAAA